MSLGLTRLGAKMGNMSIFVACHKVGRSRLNMSCECYQVGGRFIAEDPDCPAHGTDGLERKLDVMIAAMRVIIEKLDVPGVQGSRKDALQIAKCAIRSVS